MQCLYKFHQECFKVTFPLRHLLDRKANFEVCLFFITWDWYDEKVYSGRCRLRCHCHCHSRSSLRLGRHNPVQFRRGWQWIITFLCWSWVARVAITIPPFIRYTLVILEWTLYRSSGLLTNPVCMIMIMIIFTWPTPTPSIILSSVLLTIVLILVPMAIIRSMTIFLVTSTKWANEQAYPAFSWLHR